MTLMDSKIVVKRIKAAKTFCEQRAKKDPKDPRNFPENLLAVVEPINFFGKFAATICR